MKRTFIIRLMSLVLAAIMLIPAVPMQAKAFVQLPGYWTEDVYKLDGMAAHIFELENVQKDCYGFILGYAINSIEKGKLTGNFNFEVCVHDTSGNWFVAEMFQLNEVGKEIEVNVCWNKARDIDKLAIIHRKKNLQTYQRLYVIDPKDEREWYPWGIEYTYSDEKFEKSGKTTYPLILNETLHDCRGFTLHYEIDTITKGTLTPNAKYDVYARASGGKWKKIHTFNMHADEAVVDIAFSSEKDYMDIDEIAVLCTEKNGFSFVANVAISDAYYDYDYGNNYDPYSDFDRWYEEGLIRHRGVISGEYSDEEYSNDNGTTHPYVLDEPMLNCEGFTVHYQILDVSEGEIKDGDLCRVYIHTRNPDNWLGVAAPVLKGNEFVHNVTWAGPMDVDKVAVFCKASVPSKYRSQISLSDAVEREGVNPLSYVEGHWSDTKKRVSTCYAYPFILKTPLKQCTGFTVDFEVSVVSGKMKSDSKFAVYIYNGNSWEKVGTFNLEDYEATTEIRLNKTTDIYEVVAVCQNSGNFSYNNFLGIRDIKYF